uniref:NADH-ubiquinone oxidoreductase chain 6 n=1 Tax=Phrixothrix hirtus TaxID=94779 RepID=A0A0R6CPX6_PHRHR|nr:NADH dehydrogenase subunit 6 [Phrixothrix hirtus]
MKNLIMMMMFLTGMTILTTHPLMMSLIIIIQAIMVSLLTSMFTDNSWFSYTLFMIMIGGMMVMFIYMTSLTSNKKVNFKKTSMMYWTLILIFLYLNLDYYFINQTTMTNQITHMNNIKLESCMSKFMNYPLSMLMILMMIYLFIMMTASIKITYKKHGPIRQK